VNYSAAPTEPALTEALHVVCPNYYSGTRQQSLTLQPNISLDAWTCFSAVPKLSYILGKPKYTVSTQPWDLLSRCLFEDPTSLHCPSCYHTHGLARCSSAWLSPVSSD